jgi:hypothetical protein
MWTGQKNGHWSSKQRPISNNEHYVDRPKEWALVIEATSYIKQ